jgi:multiple antibiotic resistance protein
VEQFLSVALTLVLVMDPVGNIPLYITATRGVAPERRQRVVARELLISLAVMVVWLFVGGRLLELLHITQPALAIGGGAILALIALRMVFPSPHTPLAEEIDGEPFIVPMAIPYVVGPSMLATEAVFMRQMPERWGMLLGATLVCWAVTSLVLLASGFLQRKLGDKVILALERLMGMILIVMSAQMVLDGVQSFLGR